MPTRLPRRETGLGAGTRHRWRSLPAARSPEARAPGGRGLPPPARPGRCTASRLPPASPGHRVTGRAGFPGSKARQEASHAAAEPARAVAAAGVAAFPGQFEHGILGGLTGFLAPLSCAEDGIGADVMI